MNARRQQAKWRDLRSSDGSLKLIWSLPRWVVARDYEPIMSPGSEVHRMLKAFSWETFRRASGVTAVVIALSACDVTQPPGVIGCESYIDRLDSSFSANVSTTSDSAFSPQLSMEPQAVYVQSLQNTFEAIRMEGGQSLNILVLSGGGQWGAFGAGFLNGWSQADAAGSSDTRRDEIDIVTGISTGALMSSYAFLGPDWGDKLAETYLGTGPEGSDGIRQDPISDEDIFQEHGLIKTFLSNAATDPRGRLDARVEQAVQEMIDEVAATGNNHQLFVGAVNLQDGGFRVFNLKKVAQDAVAAADRNQPADRAKLEACYTEMLLASAAVPYLFPPRFMDGQAYVDGGARFGAFIRSVDLLASSDNNQPFVEKNIFVVMNGDLQVAEVTSVKNNVLDLALRSVNTVIDQIYRDSIFRIEKEANDSVSGTPWKTHYTFVNDTECRDQHLSTAEDKEHQFSPRFMKCIYDLGRNLGEAQAWMPFLDTPHVVQ